MPRVKGNPDNYEAWMLTYGKAGDEYYSNRSDRDITAKAFYYKRKVKTERVVILSGNLSELKTETAIRVTIII